MESNRARVIPSEKQSGLAGDMVSRMGIIAGRKQGHVAIGNTLGSQRCIQKKQLLRPTVFGPGLYQLDTKADGEKNITL